MIRFIKQHWPLLIGLFAFWSAIAALVFLSVRVSGGRFVYPLDDAYIHMAMAKNFASEGIWGLTKYEFSSSSSSLLWTLLISAFYFVFGVQEKLPLILNVIIASGAICLVYTALKDYGLTHIQKLMVLLILIFFTPVPPLVLSGMEHITQALINTIFVFLAARLLERDEPTAFDGRVLICLAILVPLIRYEGLFLIFTVSLLFLIRGRSVYAVTLGVASLIPITIYGLISKAQGSFWLPNSVLLKGNLPLHNFTVFVKHVFAKFILAPHLSLLLLLAVLIYYDRRRNGTKLWEHKQLLILIFIATGMQHLFFAAIGWFYRYEAYLVALGVLVVALPLLQDWSLMFHQSKSGSKQIVFVIILCATAAFYPLLIRSLYSLKNSPRAVSDIFHQHYQMGIFLRDHYPGASVAANDVGAINYFADIRCLDLWGLGSIEITRNKLAGTYSTETLAEIARMKDVKIALVYAEWFKEIGGLPSNWQKVGEWRIPACTVCGDDTVSFFAVDPEEADQLRKNLQEFSKHRHME